MLKEDQLQDDDQPYVFEESPPCKLPMVKGVRATDLTSLQMSTVP